MYNFVNALKSNVCFKIPWCVNYISIKLLFQKNDQTDVCIHVIYKAYEAHKYIYMVRGSCIFTVKLLLGVGILTI